MILVQKYKNEITNYFIDATSVVLLKDLITKLK